MVTFDHRIRSAMSLYTQLTSAQFFNDSKSSVRDIMWLIISVGRYGIVIGFADRGVTWLAIPAITLMGWQGVEGSIRTWPGHHVVAR